MRTLRRCATSCRYSGTAILLALALALPSRANTPPQPQPQELKNLKQLDLSQLGDLKVTTVSKAPEEVWKTAAAIYVITQEDIQRSGATTLPEVLRLAPGVEVARISSDKWAIGIRGFGSNLTRSVLVLIDGRTVYTTLLAGTFWDVQDVVLKDIDRIEVIRGPGGTIWGPNAVNGVINIITKNSKDTHGMLVEAGTGNIEQAFLTARYGAGNDHGLNYRVFGKAFERTPEYHSDADNYDSWRSIRGGARVDWTPNSCDSYLFEGDIYDEGAGEQVTAVSYTPPFKSAVAGTAGLSGGSIVAAWKRVQGEGEDIQLEAYYSRDNRHELNFGDLRDTFDVDFLDRFRLTRQQLSWGAGIRFSRGNEIELYSGLVFRPTPRTDQLYTGFLQDDIDVVPNRVTLSLGTKILHTNYTGVDFQPSVRLLWTPTDNQTLWGAYTHALRTPSDAERDFYLSGYIGPSSSGLQTFARFNPNSNFHSEELNGYEAGYRRLLHRNLYLDIDGFYNHYGDLFSEDLAGAPFVETTLPFGQPAPAHILIPVQFGNGLVGTTRGVELSPEWRPSDFIRLRGGYSFLDMDIREGTNTADLGTAPTVNGSSPEHQLFVESDFSFSKALRLDLTYRSVSALAALKIPSYSTGDAQLEWTIRGAFTLSLVGQNLFQPYHYEFPSDPGPNVGIARSGYIKLSWNRE